MAQEKNDKKVIKVGDKIKVEYEGRFDNKSGEIFDSSSHGNHSHPLEFEVGAKEVIAGFDGAVIGKKMGDEIEITIKPEEAYGKHKEELEQKIPKNALPKEQKPEPGMILVLNAPNGQQIPVKIKSIDSKFITIDINHPLAGKTLYFKIKITEINSN